MPLYEEIYTRYLKIPDAFLESIKPAVLYKLQAAYKDLAQPQGAIFAINQCVHLASSIVFRNPSYLEESTKRLEQTPDLRKDPTTVVTVAILYYVLKNLPSLVEKEKKKAGKNKDEIEPKEVMKIIRELRKHFDDIYWLVGDTPMKVLGIDPL